MMSVLRKCLSRCVTQNSKFCNSGTASKNAVGVIGITVGGTWLLLFLMWVMLHDGPVERLSFDSFDGHGQAPFRVMRQVSWSRYLSVVEKISSTTKRTALEAPTLLHVTHGGKAVEGVFIKKRGFKHKIWEYRKVGCNKFTMGEYRPVNNSFSCYWCPVGIPHPIADKCLRGDLLLAQQEYDDSSTRFDAEFFVAEYHMVQRPMTSQETKRNVPHENFAVSCTFQEKIPVGLMGNLIFDAPRRVQMLVGARQPEPASLLKDVVCLKPLYGTVLSADRLTSFTKFYLERWRFDAVIAYDLGMSFSGSLLEIVHGNRVLARYYDQGKLVILDLRNVLQRMYGGWAHDAVFFTREYGQLLALNDCIIRAKSHGLRWVLPVDIDEYLTYGKSHASRPGTWQQYVATKESTVAGGNLSVMRFDWKLKVNENDDRSICNLCGDQVWNEVAAAEFHKQNETNHHWQKAAMGKFAVRVDEGYLVSEFPLSVHFYQPFCYGQSPRNEIIVGADDMYLRRYRQCGRDYSSCETKGVSPWDWYDF